MADDPNPNTNISCLLEDLSQIGIVLDSKEDIVLLIQGYEKKLQELKKDLNTVRETTAKKEEELVSWMTKHIEDRQTISQLQEELRKQSIKEEENIYETIRSSSQDKTHQLNDAIRSLENENSGLKIDNESLKKKLTELESKFKNQSKDTELHRKLINLTDQNHDLLKQIDSLNAELIECKEKNSKLQHLLCDSGNGGMEKYKFSEELDKEQAKVKKIEIDFATIQTENHNIKLYNNDLKDELMFLKTQIGEADVIKKQRDLEYGFAMDQISALKKEKLNLMEDLEEKVKEIHGMKDKIMESKQISNKLEALESESMYLQSKFLKDKDAIQLELDVVRSQRERSRVELISMRQELDKKNSIIAGKEAELRDLREKQASKETPENESLYAQRDNALHVTLTKVDVNGVKQFGIFLASRPSRVLITDAIELQQKIVKAGDYVLSINGVNVQNATNEFVCSLTTEDYMNLVLLRPVASEQEFHIRNQEKGLKLEQSFKITNLTAAASSAGIRLGDEVVKINDHDIHSLSASKIEKKLLGSSVKLYIRRAEEVVRSLSNASRRSVGSDHAYEEIDSINTSPKSIRSTSRRDELSRSRVSVASSHSSTSRSTNPSGGQLEHQHGDDYETDFRRTMTYTSQTTENSPLRRDLATEQDVVVVKEGCMIRNYDTEGSGDSEVAREMPQRRSAVVERRSLPDEDGYVDMRKSEKEYMKPIVRTERSLSDISESSSPGQIVASSLASSECNQDRQSSHSSLLANAAYRPKQALPSEAAQKSSTEYDYVSHDGRFSRQGCLLEYILRKPAGDPSFGFTMFGGNCIGIYVDRVDPSSPAGRQELPKSARIVSINDQDFTDVTFCFAAETLRSLASATSLKITLIVTSADQLAKSRLQRPYDSFTVRALVDSPKMSGCTLPFSENDVLKITDTYENYDPKTGLYLWHAMKTVEGGVIREGSIPAEQSSAVPFSDDYPEAFEVYGAMNVKEKPGIFQALKRKPSSNKIKDVLVFPHGYLYEYMDESIRI